MSMTRDDLADALAVSDAEEQVVLKALELPEPWDGTQCLYCRSARWGSHRPACSYARLTVALGELFSRLARPAVVTMTEAKNPPTSPALRVVE